jgi:WD40 repeat protein
LLDYAWLKGKLSVCDVNALLADYDCFPDDAALRRLERTLRQAAHIVSRDLDQLAGQLLGRLLDDPAPEIQSLLAQVKQAQRPPCLRPMSASLRESEALLRTLEGHTHVVNAVAVTPDGQRAISASWDNMLKVWDLAATSGQELRTLTGHTGPVSGVAVTPDGQRAISASTDDTLDNISWGDCVIQDQDRNDLTGTETSAGQALPDTD